MVSTFPLHFCVNSLSSKNVFNILSTKSTHKDRVTVKFLLYFLTNKCPKHLRQVVCFSHFSCSGMVSFRKQLLKSWNNSLSKSRMLKDSLWMDSPERSHRCSPLRSRSDIQHSDGLLYTVYNLRMTLIQYSFRLAPQTWWSCLPAPISNFGSV